MRYWVLITKRKECTQLTGNTYHFKDRSDVSERWRIGFGTSVNIFFFYFKNSYKIILIEFATW